MERLLIECAIRSTLIAAAATAVLAAMRIKNVAARHSAWTSVMVFMLALPLLVTFGYAVPLRILPPVHQNAEQVEPSSAGKIAFILPQINPALSESPPAERKPGHLAWMPWIEGIYFFGVGVLLLRLITGTIGAHRVKRQARQLDGRLTSASCSSPITMGWVHAVTILPEGWQDWEPAKLDAVLIHENEHARRHDPLVQWLALVNRAIFWFHPLAWWLERRLAALSEEACDLAVLECGHHAGDYCRYLLDVANSVRASRRRIRLLGMAMPGAFLPQRIQKMLNGGLAPKVSFLRMAFATAVFFLLSVGFSTAALVRAESAKPAAIGPEEGPTPRLTERRLIVEAAPVMAQKPEATGQQVAEPSPRPRGPQEVKAEQRNEQSKRVSEQPSDEALLLQRAKDLGLNGDVEVLKVMERMRQERKLPSQEALEKEIVSQGYTVDEVKEKLRNQVLRDQVLQREVNSRVVISNDEVRKYYEEHEKDFDRAAGIHLREITVITENRREEEKASQRKKIEEALAAIKKGDDFATVAAKYSESQTASEGGDFGFFTKGELSPSFEEIVGKLEKGEVSDIIPVQGALMIIKVDDKHLGGILPFELAQKEIRGILWREAVQQKIREYLTKLRTSGR